MVSTDPTLTVQNWIQIGLDREKDQKCGFNLGTHLRLRSILVHKTPINKESKKKCQEIIFIIQIS